MTLGETLRDAREKKGIALDQAGEDTRIREKFLRALEADDWQSLPGAVYTRGFLRNYGEYLALDIEELMAAFQSERPLQNDTPQRLDPIKPIERGALIFTPKLVVPAVMRLLGDLNWWAPKPLRLLYDRIGLGDIGVTPDAALNGHRSVVPPTERTEEVAAGIR